MTSADGGDEDETSEPSEDSADCRSETGEDSSFDVDSESDSGSRFDEFHERLADRESDRERVKKKAETEEKTDDRTPNRDDSDDSAFADGHSEGAVDTEVATEGDTPTSEERTRTSSDRDDAQENTSDGWVWGSSIPSEVEQSPPNEGGEIERRVSPDSEERIWNAVDPSGSEGSSGTDDSTEELSTIDDSSGDPSGDDDGVEEISTTETGDRSTLTADSDEGGTGTDEVDEVPSEETNPDERTRWSELEASFERAQADTTGELIETEGSVSEPFGKKRVDSDGTTGSDRLGSEPSTAPRKPEHSLSRDLDRAVSASSVLLLGPTGRPISDAICSRFLTDDGESRNVIFVTFSDSPNERISICHRADEWSGGEIGIVEVGRGSRAATAASEITSGDRGGSITTRHVTNPGDLSKLGIVITQLLSAFEETPRGTVLCFHTLSALHREVGTKTLFRFLNALEGRLNGTDALGHYHIDPELHDEIVIETLRPIFDRVIRFSANGDLEIE